MGDSRYTIVKKLIIIIGIIAAILAFLIPFKAKSQLQVIGHMLDLNASISMNSAAGVTSAGKGDYSYWQTK